MTRQDTIEKAESPQAARLFASQVRDLTQRPRPANPHADMMAEYYAAREAWETERASVALYYATEEAEFAATHPRPLLRDFMKARAS